MSFADGPIHHLSSPTRGDIPFTRIYRVVGATLYGAETITAGNEIANPMYQINLALGFKPLPHGLTMKKVIEG